MNSTLTGERQKSFVAINEEKCANWVEEKCAKQLVYQDYRRSLAEEAAMRREMRDEEQRRLKLFGTMKWGLLK